MTLKELLNKLNVSNSNQYAILKSRFVDKDGYNTDFTFNGGSNGKYYSINQFGGIVRVAFDIVIDY